MRSQSFSKFEKEQFKSLNERVRRLKEIISLLRGIRSNKIRSKRTGKKDWEKLLDLFKDAIGDLTRKEALLILIKLDWLKEIKDRSPQNLLENLKGSFASFLLFFLETLGFIGVSLFFFL